MSAKRYTEEFKIEAVKQVVERNYKISDVAERLGVTPKSIHNWIDKYGKPSSQHQTIDTQQDELRKLRAHFRRVTEERDILKEPPCTLPGSQRKVHVHKITTPSLSSVVNVPRFRH